MFSHDVSVSVSWRSSIWRVGLFPSAVGVVRRLSWVRTVTLVFVSTCDCCSVVVTGCSAVCCRFSLVDFCTGVAICSPGSRCCWRGGGDWGGEVTGPACTMDVVRHAVLLCRVKPVIVLSWGWDIACCSLEVSIAFSTVSGVVGDRGMAITLISVLPGSSVSSSGIVR